VYRVGKAVLRTGHELVQAYVCAAEVRGVRAASGGHVLQELPDVSAGHS